MYYFSPVNVTAQGQLMFIKMPKRHPDGFDTIRSDGEHAHRTLVVLPCQECSSIFTVFTRVTRAKCPNMHSRNTLCKTCVSTVHTPVRGMLKVTHCNMHCKGCTWVHPGHTTLTVLFNDSHSGTTSFLVQYLMFRRTQSSHMSENLLHPSAVYQILLTLMMSQVLSCHVLVQEMTVNAPIQQRMKRDLLDPLTEFKMVLASAKVSQCWRS